MLGVGYNWRSLTSLVALLTLGLLWPGPWCWLPTRHRVVTQTLPYANGDVYAGETVHGKRQGRGSTRIKTADATREPGKTISAMARGQ